MSTPPQSRGPSVTSLMKPRGSRSETTKQAEADLHFFDANQQQQPSSDEEELQDAIATSHALVGENVVDSPNAPGKQGMRFAGALPVAPSLNGGDESNGANGKDSGGLVASGFAWVQKQKEKNRRRYLHDQAEEQLRKILEAQQHDKDSDNSQRGLTDNATFQTMNLTSSSSPAISANGSADDDILIDEEARKQELAKISRSGDGYSGALVVPSDRHEEDELFVPKVRLLTDDEVDLKSNPFILTSDQMQQVANYVLPRGIAYARWKRLYSLARDGDSFEACLRIVQPHARTLMVVRTSKNELMGGFGDSAWQPPPTHGTRYYGGATACLFRIDSTPGTPANRCLVPYRWTGANRYIQLCDIHRSRLAFGGGGDSGAFGLSVEQDFQRGSTGRCATFDNDPLCSEENFQVVDLEIYGFLLGQF